MVLFQINYMNIGGLKMDLRDDSINVKESEKFIDRYLEISNIILNYYDGKHLDADGYIQNIVRDFKKYYKSMFYEIEELHENTDSEINILAKDKDSTYPNYRLKISKNINIKNYPKIFYIIEEYEDLSLKTKNKISSTPNRFDIEIVYEDVNRDALKEMDKFYKALDNIKYGDQDGLNKAKEDLEDFLINFNKIQSSSPLVFKISSDNDKPNIYYDNFLEALKKNS